MTRRPIVDFVHPDDRAATQDALASLGRGAGGADPSHGSGLLGLKDRVEAGGGTLTVESRPGRGTRLTVELPLNASAPTVSR